MGRLPQLPRSPTFRRLAGALALTAALLLCPLPASGGISWDIALGSDHGTAWANAGLLRLPRQVTLAHQDAVDRTVAARPALTNT